MARTTPCDITSPHFGQRSCNYPLPLVMQDHWVFWLGPLFGATIATIMFEALLRPPEPMLKKLDMDDPQSGQGAYDETRV